MVSLGSAKPVRGASRSSVSPKNRYENKANPIPTLPLGEIAPFLQTDHILASSQQSKDLPYVLGNNDKHVGMLEGDILYVKEP